MAIYIGRLDRRIELQRMNKNQDESGQPVRTWGTYATVWARVVQPGQREFFASDKPNTETINIFKIRYLAGILPTDRISYGGLFYNIAPPKELGRREALEIIGTAINDGVEDYG